MALRLFSLFLMIVVDLVTAARILVIPAHNAASHTKSMYPIADILAEKGHQVVVLQLIKEDKEICKSKHESVSDIILKPTKLKHKMNSVVMPQDAFWKSVPTIVAVFAWKTNTELCLATFEDEDTRRSFEKITDDQWDVVMVDSIFCPCGIIAVQRQLAKAGSRRPIIIELSTSILFPVSLSVKGVPIVTSAYPMLQISEFKNTQFWNRLDLFSDFMQTDLGMNVFAGLLMSHVWNRGHPYREFLSSVKPVVLSELSDFSITSLSPMLDFPRATCSAIGDTDTDCPIEDKPLPERFANFVDDPKSKGTILFAMGHYTDWTYAPPGVVSAFTETFAKLPDYRIIWQYAQDTSKLNVTSNVLIDPWIPQMGILYHPKTKLFISHMGLKSLREAICAKVPVACMPMFAEQGRNTAITQFYRFGVYLNKVDLNLEDVFEKVSKVLNDASYSNAVGKLQDQLADQIQRPVDLLAFKIDFLARRNNDRVLDQFIKIKRQPSLRNWSLDTIFTSMAVVSAFLGFVAS